LNLDLQSDTALYGGVVLPGMITVVDSQVTEEDKEDEI
jgi:hypothetical protein